MPPRSLVSLADSSSIRTFIILDKINNKKNLIPPSYPLSSLPEPPSRTEEGGGRRVEGGGRREEGGGRREEGEGSKEEGGRREEVKREEGEKVGVVSQPLVTLGLLTLIGGCSGCVSRWSIGGGEYMEATDFLMRGLGEEIYFAACLNRYKVTTIFFFA